MSFVANFMLMRKKIQNQLSLNQLYPQNVKSFFGTLCIAETQDETNLPKRVNTVG